MTSPSQVRTPEPVTLGRRLAAIAYDSLLVLAVWMLGAALVVVPIGEPIASGNLLFQTYLLVLAMVYYGGCWVLGGQTVGMRAWTIRVESIDGPLTVQQVLVRLTIALVSLVALGAGFAWSLVRSDRATWHDLASGTRIVRVRQSTPERQTRRNSQ